MKKLFIFIFLFPSFLLLSQESTLDNRSLTSINLKYAPNVTFSPKISSRSIGGEWGFRVDHQFRNINLGFSAGIQYSLINIGLENEFTIPREAIEFGILESAFDIFFIPFSDVNGFRIKIGYAHGLIVKNEEYSLQSYNLHIPSFGLEYAFQTKSNLALAAGWNNKFFSLDENIFGANLTTVLYCKIGIKNL